ncbi:glycosyltransferase [Colwelliaceae bacterium BS250]
MKKFIVIVSGAVGGAEKRFFDVFRGLLEQGENVFLVLPTCLLDVFQSENSLDKYSENIISIELNHWSPIKFAYKFFKNVLCKSSSDDVFHYPLNPLFFLHFIKLRKFTMSLCHCYSTPKLSLKSKGLSLQFVASFFAHKIDILNPIIFESFGKQLPKIQNKLFQTPGGTYIFPSTVAYQEKPRNFAFIGRLEKNKGLDVLFDLIPLIDEIEKNIAFHIYGDGSLKQYVESNVNELRSKNHNVNYHGYGKISDVLNNTWCVFSLQTITNYPSRVVAESLLNGCEVIVLDSGDSCNFGDLEGIHYLSQNLTDLESIITEIKDRSSYLEIDKLKLISKSAQGQFSSRDYISYFQKLFEH